MNSPSRSTRHTRRFMSVAAVAGFAIATAGCGKAAETGIEKMIEQQSGGDVDVDLDADGGFAIETQDGSMRIDEDGNFVITDENGETITGQADGDGNMTMESEDGSVSAETDTESGEFSMETEDGEFRMNQGDEIPAEWPADVPQPSGLTVESSSYVADATGTNISLIGAPDGDGADFIADYGSALESAGYEQQSTFETEGNISRTYTGSGWQVAVNVIDGNDVTQAVVTIFPSS